MTSRVFRGPNDRQPKTISTKTVTGALLPCTFVTEGATALTQATTSGPMLRLLGNRDFFSDGALNSTDPLLTPYMSGDTGLAYVLAPGQTYQIALAAGTYTFGQELVVGAAGRATAAGAAGQVIGFFKGTPGAYAAGALADVEIANAYTKV